MNKKGKILLIIAACVLVFGILLTAISAIVIRSTGAHWVDGMTVTSSAEPRSFELNSIDSLSLSLVNEPVYIMRGGSVVTIEWSELYDGQYRLSSQDGGYLSLSRQTRWSLFSFEWGRGRAFLRPVTVTIPEDMDLSDIDLRGANIRVSMDDIVSDNLDISGANTNVTLQNIEALNIDISGANTNVTLTDVNTNSLEVRGANAEATLNDVFANSIEINGANAEATLTNISASTIEIGGANAEAILTIPSLDDWDFFVSGANSRLRIDGQRVSNFRGAGSNTVTVSGANASLIVWTQ